jgi:hypothetical protein
MPSAPKIAAGLVQIPKATRSGVTVSFSIASAVNTVGNGNPTLPMSCAKLDVVPAITHPIFVVPKNANSERPYADGKIVQREEYSDVRPNAPVDAQRFTPPAGKPPR